MKRAVRMLVSLAALGLAAAGAPRLTYTKFFKGSVPEYVGITIERDGQATYQEAKEDEDPIKIRLTATEAGEMFGLADKLDRFQRPLESGLKVANMGVKTFRFEDGVEHHEIQFNYSQDLNAQALLDWFERITETEASFISLDRTAHYDKLGVNDSLLQLQISWDHQRVVAAEQFLPLLDRVVNNESYLHVARERAAGLAEAIRKPAQTSGKAQP
jgi:hypothetical protein